MIDIDTLWGQFKALRVSWALLILALLVLAFCNGPRAAWAQQSATSELDAIQRRADQKYKESQLIVICDDKTWIPRPCNDDAPYPSFAGRADEFVEFLLAQNADLLEHQEEPVRTALVEVIRSVGGASYAIGFRDGLQKKSVDKKSKQE